MFNYWNEENFNKVAIYVTPGQSPFLLHIKPSYFCTTKLSEALNLNKLYPLMFYLRYYIFLLSDINTKL